jgi:hypothetical protein
MEKTNYTILALKKHLILLCLFFASFTNAQSNTNEVEISETNKV